MYFVVWTSLIELVPDECKDIVSSATLTACPLDLRAADWGRLGVGRLVTRTWVLVRSCLLRGHLAEIGLVWEFDSCSETGIRGQEMWGLYYAGNECFVCLLLFSACWPQLTTHQSRYQKPGRKLNPWIDRRQNWNGSWLTMILSAATAAI